MSFSRRAGPTITVDLDKRCGCRLEFRSGARYEMSAEGGRALLDETAIVYCPTHAAAERMADALADIDRMLTLAQHGKGGQAWGAVTQAQGCCRAMLKEIGR